jgi:hypothetical protein
MENKNLLALTLILVNVMFSDIRRVSLLSVEFSDLWLGSYWGFYDSPVELVIQVLCPSNVSLKDSLLHLYSYSTWVVNPAHYFATQLSQSGDKIMGSKTFNISRKFLSSPGSLPFSLPVIYIVIIPDPFLPEYPSKTFYCLCIYALKCQFSNQPHNSYCLVHHLILIPFSSRENFIKIFIPAKGTGLKFLNTLLCYFSVHFCFLRAIRTFVPGFWPNSGFWLCNFFVSPVFFSCEGTNNFYSTLIIYLFIHLLLPFFWSNYFLRVFNPDIFKYWWDKFQNDGGLQNSWENRYVLNFCRSHDAGRSLETDSVDNCCEMELRSCGIADFGSAGVPGVVSARPFTTKLLEPESADC